jgi:hypothetical protein
MRHLSRPQRTVLPQSVSRFSLYIQGRPATVATSLGETPQERGDPSGVLKGQVTDGS